MKFHRVIPYKLKRLIPMAMIAGATIAPSSCSKEKEPEPPHHDTTYIWGVHNMQSGVFGPKITASIDSTTVDHVIMLNDGESWRLATPGSVLRNINWILNKVTSDNKEKIRWAGTLNGLILDASNLQTYQDSAKLAEMGFKFGKVYHAR